jgi:hypothetical protein
MIFKQIWRIRLSSVTYQFDTTGLAPANRVIGETHTLTEINSSTYRILIPRFAPFYLDNLTVKYIDNAGVIHSLTENIDFHVTLPYIGASRSIGKMLYGAISIIREDLQGMIALDYQTLGGEWVADPDLVRVALAQAVYNPRTTVWDIVTNKPNAFPPINHSLDVAQVYGQDELIAALSGVGSAITQQAAPNAQLITLMSKVASLKAQADTLMDQIADMRSIMEDQPAITNQAVTYDISEVGDTVFSQEQVGQGVINLVGTLTAAKTVIMPGRITMYTIIDNTSGAFPVTVKMSSGTGVDLPKGKASIIYNDGTNIGFVHQVVDQDTIFRNTGGSITGDVELIGDLDVDGNVSVESNGTLVGTNFTTAQMKLIHTTSRMKIFSGFNAAEMFGYLQVWEDAEGARHMVLQPVGGGVGIGVKPQSADSERVLEIGPSNGVTILSKANDINYAENAYYEGTWRYKGNGPASLIRQVSGSIEVYTAVPGTANAEVVWQLCTAVQGNKNLRLKGTPTHTEDAVHVGYVSQYVTNQLQSYVPISNFTWNALGNKPTGLSQFTNDTGYITLASLTWGNLNGKPSSLPASDVYAWAKQDQKPSYDFSELTGVIPGARKSLQLVHTSSLTLQFNAWRACSYGLVDGVAYLVHVTWSFSSGSDYSYGTFAYVTGGISGLFNALATSPTVEMPGGGSYGERLQARLTFNSNGGSQPNGSPQFYYTGRAGWGGGVTTPSATVRIYRINS